MDKREVEKTIKEVNLCSSDGYIQSVSIIRSKANEGILRKNILDQHDIGIFSPSWQVRIKESFSDAERIDWEKLTFSFTDGNDEAYQLRGKFDYLGLDYTYTRIYKVENNRNNFNYMNEKFTGKE